MTNARDHSKSDAKQQLSCSAWLSRLHLQPQPSAEPKVTAENKTAEARAVLLGLQRRNTQVSQRKPRVLNVLTRREGENFPFRPQGICCALQGEQTSGKD